MKEMTENAMSNAITTGTTTAIQPAQRLAEIEYKLHFHITQAAGHLLDVGRCLIAAKDEGLVPHGMWQEWLAQNAGMSVRSAQRIMQAAREVPEESPLAQLDFSKVQALLSLPAGVREDFADEIDAENKSVRELEAAIKAKQEVEERLKIVEDDCIDALKEKQKANQHVVTLATKMDALRNQLSQAESLSAERLNEYNRISRAFNIAVEEAKQGSVGKGISADAQAKIDALQAELEEQEAEIARQAKLRADAQAELLRARSQAARGDTREAAEQFTADELGAAVQSFIGRASVLPYMGGQLASMSESERSNYRRYVDMVTDWCDSSKAALNTLEAGVIDA